jgi:hypothetical protein
LVGSSGLAIVNARTRVSKVGPSGIPNRFSRRARSGSFQSGSPCHGSMPIASSSSGSAATLFLAAMTAATTGSPASTGALWAQRPPFRARLAATRGAHVLTVAKADGTSLGEVRYAVR